MNYSAWNGKMREKTVLSRPKSWMTWAKFVPTWRLMIPCHELTSHLTKLLHYKPNIFVHALYFISLTKIVVTMFTLGQFLAQHRAYGIGKWLSAFYCLCCNSLTYQHMGTFVLDIIANEKISVKDEINWIMILIYIRKNHFNWPN